MKERLEQLLAAKGYTSQRFAEIMGVQPSGISHILAGRNKPRFDFLERLLIRFPDVSADWLLLGKGPMFREVTLSGSDAVKDAATYLDGRKEATGGDIFHNSEKNKGDFSVGQTVDMVGSIMDPEEAYDDDYDMEYTAGESIFERGDRLPDVVSDKSPSTVPNVENTLFELKNSDTQLADKTHITKSTESIGRVVQESSFEPVGSSVESKSDGLPGNIDTSAGEGVDRGGNGCITNVMNAKPVQAKVVKVILLYDNGTFESFDNQ